MQKDTVREEVWIRAYVAGREKTGVYLAVKEAQECLEAFDKEFKRLKYDGLYDDGR